MNTIRIVLLICVYLQFGIALAQTNSNTSTENEEATYQADAATVPAPAPESEPVPVSTSEASSEKADNKVPKEPVYFEVKDNELKIGNPLFQYDMETSKGEKLEFGKTTFDDQALRPSLHGDTFKVDWNKNLVGGGELSIIDRMGKERWKDDIAGDGSWSYKYKEGEKPMSFSPGDIYRYCLKESRGENYSMVCSRWHGVESRSGELAMSPRPEKSTPRVIFQQEEAKLKGRREVTVGSPVSFFASLVAGDSYEFRSVPHELVIRDMSVAEDQSQVVLIGQLPKPVNIEAETLKGEPYGSMITALGFEKTIGVRSDLWKGQLVIKDAALVLPGQQGGVFIYPLEIKNPPKEKSRVYLEQRVSKGTYAAQDKLFVNDAEGNIKKWEFQSPEKFKTGRVYLEVPGEVSPHKAYLDVYRAGAGEASVRLTGITTGSGQFSVFGEAHVSWWFNEIFGSPSYYFSRHRWGVSAKYFTSLTDLQEVQEGDATLSVMQADLRYRLTPGLWERDETVGLLGSYEAVKVGEINAPKMGVGVFWARSMPQVFDHWFSKLPYMNYPKWVDMEFIKYVSAMNSDDQLGEDFVINFHGKVLWTESFFGEAGFGVKNYQVNRMSDDAYVKLTTFYGTVGLGLNF